MDQEFIEFGSYRENEYEVKHFISDEYHFWIWVGGDERIARFELHYRDWRVKYNGGEFLQGSEDYVMPAFFLIDLKFNCDPELRSQLLEIRDSVNPVEADSALAVKKASKQPTMLGYF